MAKSIGIIGGTGPEGKGLAARFAMAGFEVIIGSRSAERGAEAAKEVEAAGVKKVRGGANAEAAAKGDIVIITLPYEGIHETLQPLESAIGEKVVVSTVAPLAFSPGRVGLLPTQRGSAAEDIQLLLPLAQVVAAFQNLAARKLMDLAKPLEGDVIVCSDHPTGVREVIDLAAMIPDIRGVNGGALYNSHYVEGITALLVSVNRIHRVEAAIRVVGV